jgi:hypothetical protein
MRLSPRSEPSIRGALWLDARSHNPVFSQFFHANLSNLISPVVYSAPPLAMSEIMTSDLWGEAGGCGGRSASLRAFR